MDENLLINIQRWVNDVPTIILGSGASVPFGIPGMNALGEYIKKHCVFEDDDDNESFAAFVKEFDSTKDLEASLLKVQVTKNVVDSIVSKTWECINNADLVAYDEIIKGTCALPLKDLLHHLIATSDKKVSVITTNYDRIVEYSASLIDAYINTGFNQNYIGKSLSKQLPINPKSLHSYSGIIELLKVHGSLDWFKDKNGAILHLPLRKEILEGYIPSIVTPGTSKYEETHKDPYRSIFSKADELIESSKGYLCIGYGFNDNHFQPKLIQEIKKGKPIIVLTHTLTEKTKESIIENRCKNYILLEKSGEEETKIYASFLEEPIVVDSNYWSFDVFINLIKN